MMQDIGLSCSLHIQSDWRQRLRYAGYQVHWLPLLESPERMAIIPNKWIVVLQSHERPKIYHRWWSQLPGTTVLVTNEPHKARMLEQRNQSLRMICHPSRAAVFLGEFLNMCWYCEGPQLVFGPLKPEHYQEHIGGQSAAW